MEIRDIISRMVSSTEGIAGYLLPAGKREGHEYKIGSLNGENGKSLSINLNTGIWKDFATDESGDILELWKDVRKTTIADALEEIKNYLNIQTYELYEPKKKEYSRPKELNGKLTEKALSYLKGRKLNGSIDLYGIKFEDGKIIFPFYSGGKIVNHKYLWFDKDKKKKQMRQDKGTEPCMFGWQMVDSNTREIVITEGEIDCMTMYEYGFNSVSVPNGVSDLNWIENDWDKFERFETIYLCLDMDEPGKDAAQKIAKRLGFHRCQIVELPFNDVNDCLMNDIDGDQIRQCLDNSKILNPKNLKDVIEFKDEIINEFYGEKKDYFKPGFHTGFNDVGYHPGEVTIWGGINGHGKTTFLLQFALDGISQKYKFMVASLEQRPEKYLKKIVKQSLLSEKPKKDKIEKALDFLTGNLFIYNRVGVADNDDMLETILYACKRYGTNHIIIDSLAKCGFSEDDYRGQKFFIERLTEIALEYNIHIHLVAHSRKKYDEKVMNKMDVKGTGAITDLASNVMLIVRNKKRDRKQNELDAALFVEKQREIGWEGIIKFKFNKSFETFSEDDNYIDYLDELGERELEWYKK